ncbi:MAG: hypothetical protein NT177_05795 [Chloroflexi bacterium]|nr:hypothetical protein [Chloroflexota bacterium]
MQKEVVSCEKTREIRGVKLTPVVRSTLTWVETGGTVSFYASMQPVYILIEFELEVRALRATGEEITLQQLCSECPAIREGLVEGFPVLLAQQGR